ncbi:uncharacterized protein C6orf132 homolog [Oreochromis niloticus]|uniref:uncharacterized protein C6orf132 homolog n=1 Tax=Oreochromis niloticus TaxID=8128 RepID=UPI000DF1A38E|nr:uncharacterized protein C6orf132 homolog [Oreochromis niloticus]CAI5677244.1 unnamed protein product [Mustela putorius furo]
MVAFYVGLLQSSCSSSVELWAEEEEESASASPSPHPESHCYEPELEFQVYSEPQEVLVPEQPQSLSSAKLPECSAEQFLDMLPPADSMPPKPAGPEPAPLAPPEPLCPKSVPSVALEL